MQRSVRRTACGPLLAVLMAAAALSAQAKDDAAQLKLGKDLFVKSAVPACALCHTLRDAQSTGEVGPVLDELKPDAARVAQALRNGIGQMPSYAGSLNDKQIAAVAAYVAKASEATK